MSDTGLRTAAKVYLVLGVAVSIVVLDQITKAWAMSALRDGPIDLLESFLRLRLTRNPGAAFSILQNSGTLLAVFALVTVAVIVFLIRDLGRRLDIGAMALIMGGALGNLLDRLFRGDGLFDGAVVDFVDFSFWPTFNVADSAITIGVIIVLLSTFRR